MENHLIVAVLATAITAGTPLLYASLGELITERAGILNLGVEGIMLTGAVSGFICAYNTGNPWLGVLAAAGIGMLVALIHAFLTITLRANQVVSGLAITLFGTGLSSFIGRAYVGKILPHSFKPFAIPGLADIPYLGPIVFRHDMLVYLSYVLVLLIYWYI